MNIIQCGNIQITLRDHVGWLGQVHPVEVVTRRRPPAAAPRQGELIGRRPELDEVAEAVRLHLPIELVAPCGFGKSTLLTYVAAHSRVHTAYLEAGGDAPDDLLQRLTDVVYTTDRRVRFSPAECVALLNQARVTLILDDVSCTHEDIAKLVQALSACDVVVASSSPVLPTFARSRRLAGLPPAEAERLIRSDLDRAVAPSELAALHRVIDASGGRPDRLRRAAALVRSGEHSFPTLSNLSPDELDRLSIAGLRRVDRVVLGALGALAGGLLPADLVEAISSVGEAAEVLEDLTRRGLAEQQGDRFGLPLCFVDSQRELLMEYLDTGAAVREIVNWLASQAPTAQDPTSVMSAVLTLIKFAAERREWDAVSRLVRVAEPILTLAGRWESCREALTLGLRAADALHDQATQALFHHQLGTLALCSDEIDVARRHLAQALELREALNDRRGAQATRHNLDLLPIGWFSRTWRAVRSPAVARSLIALFVLVPIIIAGAGTVAAMGGGDGVQLQVDPAGLNFGTQAVNTASAPSALTVRNPGDRPAGLNAVTVAGPAASDFAIGTDGCGQTALAAGSSCQVLLSFSPTAEGRREGTLKITDAVTETEWVATLAGVGLRTGASLTSDPSALDFPDQRLGRSSPSQTITITNGTDATQELGSVIPVGPNEDEFRVAESNCGAPALPSGKNCRIAVTFTPAAEGNRAAMVQLAVPGPLPDVVIPVSGRGLPVSSGPPTITVPPGLVLGWSGRRTGRTELS